MYKGRNMKAPRTGNESGIEIHCKPSRAATVKMFSETKSRPQFTKPRLF